MTHLPHYVVVKNGEPIAVLHVVAALDPMAAREQLARVFGGQRRDYTLVGAPAFTYDHNTGRVTAD
jgi:hypothetical protein